MKDQKIRVLHVVNGLAIGGGELKLLELVKNFTELLGDKYEVTVCSVGQGGPLYEDFKKLGIDLYVYEKKHKFDVTQVEKVYRIIKEKDIDIVQTTLFYADVIGALAARMAGLKAVVSWETVSHPADSHEHKLRHRVAYRYAMRHAKKIVSVSDAVKKFLITERGIPPEKVETIHYGIDLSLYPKRKSFLDHQKRKTLGFTENDFVIGTVARLTHQKGHQYLIEAMPEIVKQIPIAHFVFVGDGPLREKHQSRIRELGLQERVHFLGFRKDVSELLQTFNLFVLPSLFEGLPNVILEAMASSRPIVATAVDGTPELIQHNQSGWLVQPRSPDKLQDAVVSVYKRPDQGRAIGAEARKRVEEKFTFQHQLERFERLYSSLLPDKPAA